VKTELAQVKTELAQVKSDVVEMRSMIGTVLALLTEQGKIIRGFGEGSQA
jgi:hypothetical protein